MKRLFLAMMAVSLFCCTAVFAGDQTVLVPLLTDLPGWKAEKAEGMSMDMGTMKMTSATRTYEKGDSVVSVVLMVGSSGMAQGQYGNMNMETDEVKARMGKIDGFDTSHGYDKKGGTGSFMVILAHKGQSSGFLGINYEGISMADAEKIARKFDWAKMKKAVKQIL